MFACSVQLHTAAQSSVEQAVVCCVFYSHLPCMYCF
jgi:hypothetical protein